MNYKNKFFTLFISILMLGLIILPGSGNNTSLDAPEPFFEVTLNLSWEDSKSYFMVQILRNESVKIGIKIQNVVLTSNEALFSLLFQNIGHKTSDASGFDLAAFEWDIQSVSPKDLWRLYHSNNINPTVRGSNYFPCNDSELDEILDKMQSLQNFDNRKAQVNQALNKIIWELHPATGLYQINSSFALDSEIGAFDAVRWAASPVPNLQEMYFDNNDESVFMYGGMDPFQNLNPILSTQYYDRLIHGVVFSKMYESDSDFNYQPVLATTDPIAIGSNDAIANTIDLSTISNDSLYKNQTIWGPNPNIDYSVYDPNVTIDNKSMFLITLRQDIPWHSGYGYNLGDFNVTSDDLIWTLSYMLNKTVKNPYLPLYHAYYGTNYTKCIEKINDTTVKINLRGNLADGSVADWYEALAISPLPQHILDPTFNATLWGGDIGETPDGTQIATYEHHSTYTFNTGETEHSLVGTGPYRFVCQDGLYYDSKQKTYVRPDVLLVKFEDWGGYDDHSLWRNPKYSVNNITAYGYNVIDSETVAGIALEDGDIDCMDYKFYPSSSLERDPNIQFIKFTDLAMKTLAYNTYHPELSNRFVRLAISHIIPRQSILNDSFSGAGLKNEIFGLSYQSSFYPSESVWDLFGLSDTYNTENVTFQGHIDYNLEKAWALMELAGYNMSSFRAYYGVEPPTPSSKTTSGCTFVVVAISLVLTLAVRKKTSK